MSRLSFPFLIISLRASAAANGRPPPDYAAVTAQATDRTIRALCTKIVKLEANAKDKPKEKKDDGGDHTEYSGRGKGKWRHRGGRGGGRGGGGRGGRGGGEDRGPPGKKQKIELCFKFNDNRGCPAAKAGKSVISLPLPLFIFLFQVRPAPTMGDHSCIVVTIRSMEFSATDPMQLPVVRARQDAPAQHLLYCDIIGSGHLLPPIML